MKTLLIICAALLLIGIINLPIGYFTFLRIIVTIGSLAVVLNEFENGISFWVITFGLILILFNPIIPIYLHNKSAWMPIDLISGIVFLIYAFKSNRNEK